MATNGMTHGKTCLITELIQMSGRKQIHDATFEASKIYATAVFHGNKEHGKHVLITLNKTPLLIMIQRCTDLLQTSRQNAKY